MFAALACESRQEPLPPCLTMFLRVRRLRRRQGLASTGSITRLVGSMMLEKNDEWSLNLRFMQPEGRHVWPSMQPTRAQQLEGGVWAGAPNDLKGRVVLARRQLGRLEDARSAFRSSRRLFRSSAPL